MSFSWEQRAEIARRANGIDEITGLPIHQGEAAHIDHTKNENYFDYDNNSLFVNAITHAWMHLIDEDPGLTTKGNKWSKNKITCIECKKVGFVNQTVEIRNPDNPANLIKARLIKYEI